MYLITRHKEYIIYGYTKSKYIDILLLFKFTNLNFIILFDLINFNVTALINLRYGCKYTKCIRIVILCNNKLSYSLQVLLKNEKVGSKNMNL